MSELDLDAIKARTEAATEGSWEVDGGGTSVAAGMLWVAHVVDHQEPDVPVQARADATFIAAARTDVPALVAEVERQVRRGDRLHDDLYRMTRIAGTYMAERDALAAQVERVRLAASDWITGAAHLHDTFPGVAAVMVELADDVHRALDGEADQ